MKIVRYLIAAMLLVGLTGVANATIFRVLDPSGTESSFPTITPGSPLAFSFFDCPVGIDGDGCFGAVNNTNQTLTSFQAVISADDVITSALVCPSTVSTTEQGAGLFAAFSNPVTCTASGNTIMVDLSGTPGIQPFSTFYIVETGVPDSEFTTPGSFTASATPEPGSIWMALTGLGSFGYVVRRRRKVAL